MKDNSHIAKSILMTLIFTAFGAPQYASAEQIKAVMSKVTAIGTGAYNTSAQAVKAGTGLVVMGKGTRYDTSGGQFKSAGGVSQIQVAMPSKNSDLSFVQSLCLQRFEALQAGHSRRPLEVTFEGSLIGNGNYSASKLLGCADVAALPSSNQPKPTATPTPVATPKPKV